MGVASDIGEQAGDATSSVADSAEAAAGKVKRAAEGNPVGRQPGRVWRGLVGLVPDAKQ